MRIRYQLILSHMGLILLLIVFLAVTASLTQQKIIQKEITSVENLMKEFDSVVIATGGHSGYEFSF